MCGGWWYVWQHRGFWLLLCVGVILFLPGVYYSRIACLAARGSQKYRLGKV